MYYISKRVVPMQSNTFDIYDITLGNPAGPEEEQVKVGSACIDLQTRTVRGLFIDKEYRSWGYAGRLLDQIYLDRPDAFVCVTIAESDGLSTDQIVTWLERRGMYIINRTETYVLLAPLKNNIRIEQ